MDDLERYGDYNEVDEPPQKNTVLTLIKIVAIAICVLVAAVVAFRLFTFNYYPDSMKKLVFTPTLTEHYNDNGGDISALTQSLRAPYDNAEQGNFFCDNLIVIRDIGELQISLRYNTSLAAALSENYSYDGFDPDDTAQFSFRLWRDGVGDDTEGCEVGTLTYESWESHFMYRYCKLVFDGIDFGTDGTDEQIEWLRLEIFIDGVENDTPFMVAVYENNSAHSSFDDYKLSRDEVPK